MRVMIAILAMVLWAGDCAAAVKTVGKQDTLAFDATAFPPAMKARYEMVRSKCVRCHSLERVVVAVTTGIAPITGQPFNHDSTRVFGCKLCRKPNANLSKKEVQEAMELLNYLLDQAQR